LAGGLQREGTENEKREKRKQRERTKKGVAGVEEVSLEGNREEKKGEC